MAAYKLNVSIIYTVYITMSDAGGGWVNREATKNVKCG
jgi:hypothetical protein